jgi:hypothetical protein
MNAFIANCVPGEIASSHAFFSLSFSMSALALVSAEEVGASAASACST